MNALTHKRFTAWMRIYSEASAQNDPKASANLFAQDARYYENPFDEPIIGHGAIYEYWNKGARTLKDKETSFEIFSVQSKRGIARWHSKFTVIETGKRLELDCLFVVEFNDEGFCQTFREWWHIRDVPDA